MLLVSHWGAFEFNPQSMHYQNGHESKPKPFEKIAQPKCFKNKLFQIFVCRKEKKGTKDFGFSS